MNAPHESGISRTVREAFVGQAARSARVVISWTAAGGITAGGLLIGVAALGSPEMARGLLPLAPVLFLIGAAGGLVHGSILAYLGRPPAVGTAATIGAIGSGVLLSIPALAVAWVATAWISLTSAVVALHVWTTTFVALAGWIVGVAACCWAAVEGWEAFCTAFSRWPESRPGALLLVVVGALFAVLFVRYHPAIWLTDFRVTGVGALILALVATVWIALPIIVVLLHYLHRHFASVWDRPTSREKTV